jgi:hypothetical protein
MVMYKIGSSNCLKVEKAFGHNLKKIFGFYIVDGPGRGGDEPTPVRIERLNVGRDRQPPRSPWESKGREAQRLVDRL